MKAKKELVDYIDKELGKGVRLDRIKSELYSAGHKVDHVESAASYVKSRKTLKITLLVVVVILVILAMIMVTYGMMKSNGVVSVKKTTTTTLNSAPAGDDNYFYAMAFETGDTRYCGRIQDPNTKQECVRLKYILNVTISPEEVADINMYKRAFETGNPALCNNINGVPLRDLCLSVVR